MPQSIADVELGAGRLDPAQRKPPELQTEHDDEKESEPERRRRQERERRSRDDVVKDGVLAEGGHHPYRDHKEQDDDEHGGHERERVRQPLADQLQDGQMMREAVAPVAGQEAAQPRDVLDWEWTI